MNDRYWAYATTPPPWAGHLSAIEPVRPRIVDVGTAWAEDAVRACCHWPRASVLAIEPDPGNVTRARQAVAGWGLAERITLVECAVGETPGPVTLWRSSGHPPDQPRTGDWDWGCRSGSVLPPTAAMTVHYGWLQFDPVAVLARRLDEVLAACEWDDPIDLVHVDCQGAELAVLRSLGDRLARVRAVYVEVCDTELYRGQARPAEVADLLQAAGLTLTGVWRDSPDSVYSDQFWGRYR